MRRENFQFPLNQEASSHPRATPNTCSPQSNVRKHKTASCSFSRRSIKRNFSSLPSFVFCESKNAPLSKRENLFLHHQLNHIFISHRNRAEERRENGGGFNRVHMVTEYKRWKFNWIFIRKLFLGRIVTHFPIFSRPLSIPCRVVRDDGRKVTRPEPFSCANSRAAPQHIFIHVSRSSCPATFSLVINGRHIPPLLPTCTARH